MQSAVLTSSVSLNLRTTVVEYISLTIGSIILAINFNVFLAPSNIAPGGVSGLAIILHAFTGWRPGATMFALTLPMLIVGFYHLGRFQFLVRATCVTVLYSVGVDALAGHLPRHITDDLLLSTIYGGILSGIGIGLVFRGGAAFAGTSVISRMLHLRTGLPYSQLYLLIDGSVILIAGFVFGWEMALYAFITLFLSGLVADYVLEGPSVVRSAFIVTDAPEQVSEALRQRLETGVTGWSGEGGLSHARHTILFCTVYRPDVTDLKAAVYAADPEAFVVIVQGNQTRGGTLPQALRRLSLQHDPKPRTRSPRKI